ncbi:hypothetical protein UT300013_33680 [Paraclostridium sordellii]
MKIFWKITTVVLSIIIFGGPQLHKVDAIEILNDTKTKISKYINS